MLEQLYFTWSTIGLGDVPGFRVRAASAAISNINSERYNSLKAYLNYNLPQGTDAYAADATLDRTPTGLVYADTGKERIIAQKVYKGRDKYNRPGVYFVHLLAGLPEGFLARDAIDLWRSRSWITDIEDERSVTLPQLRLDDFKRWPGTLSEHDVASVQQYLPWLIQAYLTLDETQKIYIAAPNPQIAILLWGLAHSVPRTLQQTLTFSTYEQDVTKSSVRIACTSEPTVFLQGYSKSAQLLPTECYSGKGVAFDCYSGKTSDLKYVSQEIVDYSLYATACLVQGRKKELDELLDTADRLETKDINGFLAFRKLYSSLTDDKALTPQEVTGLLGNEKLVAAFLHQEKVQRAIISLAIANPGWWSTQAAPALLKLCPPFDAPGDTKGQQAKAALTTFAGQVAQTLYATMVRNQTRSSETLMQVLYAVAPPNKDVSPWLKLLQSFSEHMAQDKQFRPAKAFSWEFRAWLLQQWVYGYQQIPDEMILPWLQLNWNDFTNLLILPNMPEKWRQLALMQLLSRSSEPLPKEIVKLFNNPKYQPFCLGALKELMRFASTQPAALHCFQKLVQYGYGNKIFLLMTLLNVRTASKKDIITPEMLDDFLRATRMKDKEKIELLEQYSSLLLGAGHQELAPTLVDVITVYVDNLSVDNLLDKSAQVTLQTLDLLGQQTDKLPTKVANHIKVWLCVSYGIVHDPFVPLPLDKIFLSAMGKYIVHFKLQHDKKYRENLFLVIVNSIQAVEELDLILEVFFEPLQKESPKELLYDLSAFIGERYNSTTSYRLLLPYLAEALKYSSAMKAPEDKEEFLVPLLKALLKNVNSYTFDKLSGTVATWPKAYQKDWQDYAARSVSKSFLQKVSDVGGNVIGGVGEVVGGGAKAIGGVIGAGRGNDDGRSPSRPLTNEPNTSQEEPLPQNRNGQGSIQNQQNMQPEHQRPQSNVIQQNMGYRPPVSNQQQGGQSFPPPMQPPVNVVPPQQNQPQIYQPTQIVPPIQPVQPPAPQYNQPVQSVQQSAPQYDQSVPYQAQTYSVPQQEPQSTVNGQHIYPEQIVAVYKLKGPYIEHRKNEIKNEIAKLQKKNLGIEWLLDERDLLDDLINTDNILKLLEMDIIIKDAIGQYASRDAQLNPLSLFEKVYKDVQKKYQGYPEEEVKNVLRVFVCYRVLSEYFRKQDPPIRLRHWLDKQWVSAWDNGRIVRSPNPLPDVK
jgi:hypothetical protein